MRIELPQKVKQIVNTITEAGYEAYVVGGCVRDSILGREPQDWDITTSATPQQVKKLFIHTIDTGIQHGTVTVMLEKEGFEVTTYRIDGEYEDNRHPKEVTFTPNLIEDLKRRDFTINAMAYNEQDGLVDAFEGMKDIERKVIRCVGEPTERFTEDALRMMRAVRFSAQLGYAIEERTKEAIVGLAKNLKNISAERIQVELTKLLVSPYPERIRIAYETGITKVILPEFDDMMNTMQNHPHHMYTVGEHSVRAICEVPPRKELRLAMLLHDMGKVSTLQIDDAGITHFHGHASVGEEMAKKILRRLRFDNDTIYCVSKLVRFHDYGNGVEPDERILRRAIHTVGEDIFPLLYEVRKADVLAQSDYMRKEKLELLEKWQAIYKQVCEKNQCVSLKDLAVTGKDLMEAGMKPGKELGDTLNRLLELVLDHPEYNTKETLLKNIVLPSAKE